MKRKIPHYVAKLLKYFRRKKVVEKLKSTYQTSTIQSVKDEILITLWNDGFPNDAVDLFEKDEAMTKEKFDHDVHVFAILFLLISFGFTLIKIVF